MIRTMSIEGGMTEFYVWLRMDGYCRLKVSAANPELAIRVAYQEPITIEHIQDWDIAPEPRHIRHSAVGVVPVDQTSADEVGSDDYHRFPRSRQPWMMPWAEEVK